ncbi:hypothetical protein PMAC_002429 [Pneumocystis sp. 'macacae']|nr:hypothetical protein PMAC_002429 [Pneumocystis sp. 'macacae']
MVDGAEELFSSPFSVVLWTMEQSIELLETWIQQEQKVITYLFLCRSMGIHVEDAKEALLSYYRKCRENNKKCHAIYMVSGYISKGSTDAGSFSREETISSSNALDTSIMSCEPLALREKVFYLVKEEDLGDVKQELDEITSIHIYALEYDSYKDISVLSDASLKSLYMKYNETLSSKEMCEKYGMIYHPSVEIFLPILQELNKDVLETKFIDTISKTNLSQPNTAVSEGNEKEEATFQSSFSKIEHNSKSLFEATRKNASKLPKKKTNTMKSFFNLSVDTELRNSHSPLLSPTASGRKNSCFDYYNDDVVENLSEIEEVHSEQNIIKRQKEIDELKRIMMTNQEGKDDVLNSSKDMSKDDKSSSVKSDQVDSTKKKGRRKVLKKVTCCDKKGYLVTKNEFVWESFSEDEISVPLKSKFNVEGPKETVAKNKTKLSETKITSFFSKK